MRALLPVPVRTSLPLASAALVLAALGCTGSDPTGPSLGGIAVTVATTGSDQDPDGYQIMLDGDPATQAIVPDNGGGTTFPGLIPGAHAVAITDLMPNCTVSGQASVRVYLRAGSTEQVAFAVTCAAPGAIQVTAATTGTDLDPDGYAVLLDGGAATQALPINGGSATFSQVAPGSHTIDLTGLAANCTVSGSSSVPVTVASAATAQVAFTVACVAFGAVQVTATTTGTDLDPDGYAISVDGGGFQALPINGGSVTFSQVAPGSHTVDLSGNAANCTVSGSSSVPVTVASAATAQVALTVTCVAFGAVQVTATTTGTDLDPDGYTIFVDGVGGQTLPTNGGSVTFSQVAPGTHTVDLSSLAANCTVSGGSQVTVTVASSATATVAFAVTCTQIMPTGSAIAFGRGSDVYLITGGAAPAALTNSPGADAVPVWSPDGTRIAFQSDRDGNWEIYLMHADGSGQLNLTNNPAIEAGQVWSPDGSKIAFMSSRNGNAEIYVMNADGSGQVNLSSNPANDGSPAWSPDGRTIAFVSDRDGNWEIYRMNADGSQPVNLSSNPAADVGPVWSPDGSRIAFVSDRGGSEGIYLMAAGGIGQIPLVGGSAPAWSPDGMKLAFTSNGIAVINPNGSGFAQLVTNQTTGGCGRFGCGTSSRTSSSPVWSPDGSRIAFQWVSTTRRCGRGGCGPIAYRSGVSLINPDGSAPFVLVDDGGAGDGSPAWKPQ